MENKTVKISIPQWIKKLKLIFHPIYWSFMLCEYDSKLDAKVNNLIDNYKAELGNFNFIDKDYYAIIFNDENKTALWIQNYPYAYGREHGNSLSIRPSRITILKLRKLENKLRNK